jgi:hypothetical protein
VIQRHEYCSKDFGCYLADSEDLWKARDGDSSNSDSSNENGGAGLRNT